MRGLGAGTLGMLLAVLTGACGGDPARATAPIPNSAVPASSGGAGSASPSTEEMAAPRLGPTMPPQGAGGSQAQAPTSCSSPPAVPSGYCFAPLPIGGGGFVSGLVTSRLEQGLLYARTDVGGAYRWSSSDSRWIPLLDWLSEDQVGLLGVESLALDPQDPSRLYLLAGINYFNGGRTAILRSSDQGATFDVIEVTAQFTAHGNGMGRQSGEKLAVDPNDGSVLFTGTRGSGLMRSADRGSTWSRVAGFEPAETPNGNGIAFVVFNPASGSPGGASSELYVGVSRAGEDNLFVSRDAGATWAPVAGQPTEFAPQRAVLSNSGVLHITYANGAGPFPSDTDPMDRGAVWKLDLGAGSWTEITPLRGEQNRAFGGISVDTADPSHLLSTTINTYLPQPWGYGDRIFVSSDAGASWTDLIGAGRVQMDTAGMPWIEQSAIHWAGSIEFDPFDPRQAWVTSGNGVFRTADLDGTPSTWAFHVQGLEELVPLDAVSVSGAPLISAVGDYDGFIHDPIERSPQGGRHRPNIGTTQAIAVANGAPLRLARVGNELQVSDDGAQTWQTVTRPTEAVGGRVALATDGSVLLWTVGTQAFRSADSGQTWSAVTGLDVETHPVADGSNPLKFYAYDPRAGGVLASGDGGQTFAPVAALPSGGATRVRTVPDVEGELWVALNSQGLARSTDSGASFAILPSLASCRAVGFGRAAQEGGFPAVYVWGAPAGEPRGLYRSDDQGGTWLRLNDDAHEYGGPGNGEFVFGDANVYGRVFMSSAGRGLIMGEPMPAAK